MSHLSWNRYGKSRIRLVKVRRPAAGDGPHEIVDLTLDVQLEGAFDAVYVEGDNQGCLATDTMKNTVYALARRDPIDHVESFALRLADHFVGKPQVERASVAVLEHVWHRIPVGGRPHPHAFVRPGGEHWTTVVVRDAAGVRLTAGLADLVVMKTTDSSFAGFSRDEFTTLPDTADRVVASSITASWIYQTAAAPAAVAGRPAVGGAVDLSGFDYASARQRIRDTLIETFAAHDSRSVQHTMYAMGAAALQACAELAEITLAMPNRHHLLVDLEPFGLDNPNVVFVATDQPFGLIEATIRR